MPYHSPIPDPKARGKASALVDAIVQAEKMIQVAFVLPCSVLIGWAIGWLLDRGLHQSWIYLVGIVFGGVSGLVYAVRLAVSAANRDDGSADSNKDSSKNSNRDGGAGTTP